MIDFMNIGKLSITTVDGTNPANQLKLVGFSHFLPGFIHPRWCRISSISSIHGHFRNARSRGRWAKSEAKAKSEPELSKGRNGSNHRRPENGGSNAVFMSSCLRVLKNIYHLIPIIPPGK